MKIYEEKSLSRFEFWSGGKDTADSLTEKQLDQIEFILEDLYPDGIEDSTLNDILWFERDEIAEWLGFKNWEQLEKVNSGKFSYVIRLDDADEDCGSQMDVEFETAKDAENWVDEIMPTNEEFIDYFEKWGDTDVYICNTIDEDDFYCYKTIEKTA